jgi:antitoxin (DNA-binding transcriptional repressor) of toxin-antitoxin stability system
MRFVSLSRLKTRLSEYVRLAMRGETVLIVDADRIVAELRPPAIGRRGEWIGHAPLADLIREGVLRPPLLPRGTVPGRSPAATASDLLRELAVDRDDR